MDTNRIRELCDARDKIDAELRALVNGEKERRPQSCKSCGAEGHNSRVCPKRPVSPDTPRP